MCCLYHLPSGDAHSLKALYRRGQAHAALEHHQLAEADLQRSLELSAHDAQQQQLIREKLKAVQDKQAEVRQLQQQQAGTGDHAAAVGNSEQSTVLSHQQVRQDAEDGMIEEIPQDRPQWQQHQNDNDDYADMPVLADFDTKQPLQQQTQRQEDPSTNRRNQQQGTAGNSSSVSSMPGYDGLSASQRAQMDQVASMMKANPELGHQVTLEPLLSQQLLSCQQPAGFLLAACQGVHIKSSQVLLQLRTMSLNSQIFNMRNSTLHHEHCTSQTCVKVSNTALRSSPAPHLLLLLRL